MCVRIKPLLRWVHQHGTGKLLFCVSFATALSAQAATDLTALSLEQLLDLRVVGASKYEQKQSQVAAAVNIITRDEIRTFGWRTLGDALASLPGMYVIYDRQYQYIGARGFGLPGDYNTRVLVTVNGNRINDALFDVGQTGRSLPLDLDLVERIEFIPGPGGAVYGQNAMLGVVNVITRSGSGVDGAEVVARFQQPGLQREGRVSWGKTLDNGLDVLLSASGLAARGQDLFFNYDTGVSGVAAGLDGDRVGQFYGKASLGPWSFEFMHGKRRKDDPTGAFKSDPFVAGSFQSDRYTFVQGQYQDNFLDNKLQVNARLFAGQNQYDSTLSYTTPFQYPAFGNWQGGELRALYLGISDHKLLLGLEAQNSPQADQYVIDTANPANNLVFSSPALRKGIYAQDEWRISEPLTATLGLRVDNGTTSGTKLSPRAGLIWQASDATTLKALYGRAHRAPNSYERDYDDQQAQVANPNLRGERIDTMELVADQRVGSDLQLRASLYQWKMHDIIQQGTDPISGIAQYQSGAEVTARGLELSADKSWKSGARLRGSLSLQNASQPGGVRLANSPQVLAKMNYSAPLPVAGLRLGYELRYDGPRLAIDGGAIGGYAVSNLRLSTDKLAKGLEVAVTLRNLFDKRYSIPGSDNNWQKSFEQDGRSVQFEALYRF